MLQEELKGVKQQLASKGDEVQQLQMHFVIAKMQVVTAQTETHVLKERYARLDKQEPELRKKLFWEVIIASLIYYLPRVASSIGRLVIFPSVTEFVSQLQTQFYNTTSYKQVCQKCLPWEMPQAACAEQHAPIHYSQRHSREPACHI